MGNRTAFLAGDFGGEEVSPGGALLSGGPSFLIVEAAGFTRDAG